MAHPPTEIAAALRFHRRQTRQRCADQKRLPNLGLYPPLVLWLRNNNQIRDEGNIRQLIELWAYVGGGGHAVRNIRRVIYDRPAGIERWELASWIMILQVVRMP